MFKCKEKETQVICAKLMLADSSDLLFTSQNPAGGKAKLPSDVPEGPIRVRERNVTSVFRATADHESYGVCYHVHPTTLEGS